MPVLWNATDEARFGAERQARGAEELLETLRLGALSGALGEELFCPEFSCNALRPELRDRRNAGGIRVRLADSGDFGPPPSGRGARDRLADFFSALDGGQERRIAFKIIGVETRSEGSLWADVLVQTSVRHGAGASQQNARWAVVFRAVGPSGELRLRSIEASSLSEVELERVAFVDASARALAAAGGSSVILAKGSEHWQGRIDNLGESNYFGHNGIAVGDVNGDDLDDLYVAQGTGLPNLLFIQQTDGSFLEEGEASGAAWLDDTKGVLLADYDNDGDRDLIAAIGPLIVLSRNDGKGHFLPDHSLGSESTSSFYSLSAADYDLDGDLDLFGVRYVASEYGQSVPMPFQDARNGPKNHLMRNDGEAGFVDVTAEVGLDSGNDRFSLASSWSDYDLDGDPDLYVANDFGRNNLYRNDHGHFVDVAAMARCEDQAAGMGVAWSDVDLDGRFDLLVSNMFSSAGRRIAYQSGFKPGEDALQRGAVQRHSLGNSLFCARADGTFEDISQSAGLRMGRWAWGARFSDFDLDGLPDVIVPNGFLTGDRDDDL